MTGTVESIDLITASILSKKLAAGLEGLVLDVKVGSGAFMKTMAEAEALARALVSTAQGAGCMTTALITDMSQPLATAAGNALEVIEVMETLTGTSVNAALWDLTAALGGEALALGGLAADAEDGAGRIDAALESGAGGRDVRAHGRGPGRPCRFRRPLARPAALGPDPARSAEPARRVRDRDRRLRCWVRPSCIWAGAACATATGSTRRSAWPTWPASARRSVGACRWPSSMPRPRPMPTPPCARCRPPIAMGDPAPEEPPLIHARIA